MRRSGKGAPPGRAAGSGRDAGRRERVAERIRQEAAGILRFDLADPRVGRATVTRVEMSRDLGLARVYVSILGDSKQQAETLAALRRAGGRVRSLLGARVRLRATPEVKFVFDPSVEFGIRLEEILEAERARSPAEAPAEGGEAAAEAGAGAPGEAGSGTPGDAAGDAAGPPGPPAPAAAEAAEETTS